jgi:glycosyltransferase involved in cell wall biosynthesis
MKIAILGIKGIPGHHGVEVVVDSLVPHLAAEGHDITVYGYNTYSIPSENYKGIRVRTVPGSSGKNCEMISHMWNASLDARREGFDLVHIHSTDPCLLAWLPRPKHGVVATSHGQAYIRKKWGPTAKIMSRIAERIFIKYPDVITSVSKPLCDYYFDKYRKEVLYIPNGIEFREKPDERILKKWGLTPEGYIFSSAGRIERTKGLSTLLEAYKQVGTDLPLIIAGGGSATDFAYFNELKENKPDGVKFVGFLYGDELYSLYAHARIFVFPSEYEAMAITLLEGLSFGIPTVYSDIPENEAVARDLGFSFKVSDPRSLSERLSYVLDNRDEAVRTGQKARDYVRRHHDWAAIAKRYNEIYVRLYESSMKNHRRAGGDA